MRQTECMVINCQWFWKNLRLMPLYGPPCSHNLGVLFLKDVGSFCHPCGGCWIWDEGDYRSLSGCPIGYTCFFFGACAVKPSVKNVHMNQNMTCVAQVPTCLVRDSSPQSHTPVSVVWWTCQSRGVPYSRNVHKCTCMFFVSRRMLWILNSSG